MKDMNGKKMGDGPGSRMEHTEVTEAQNPPLSFSSAASVCPVQNFSPVLAFLLRFANVVYLKFVEKRI